MKITEVKCENCGKVFKSYRSSERKYCSHRCANIISVQKMKERAERIKYQCLNCGKEFSLLASQMRVRVKTAQVKYCSLDCYYAAIKTKERICAHCQKPFEPQRATSKYCSVKCKNEARIGKKRSEFWYENGYRVISLGDGVGIKEHIKIMEDHIGRKLEPDEIVHHINFVRDDNRLENLQLLKKGDHSKLHRGIEKANGKKFGRYGKTG